MLADQLAYVALASSDPFVTCAALERHFGLARTGFDAPGGSIPLFALGPSALAVFPVDHPMLAGPPRAGVDRIGFIHPKSTGGVLLHVVERPN